MSNGEKILRKFHDNLIAKMDEVKKDDNPYMDSVAISLAYTVIELRKAIEEVSQ